MKKFEFFAADVEQYKKEIFFSEAIKRPFRVKCVQINDNFTVHTLEGVMQGKPGDYLLIGVNNELYPCDKEIFETTYDVVS